LAIPAQAQATGEAETGLAAQSLSEGESVRAITMLKSALQDAPNDPALLINLGIAYAQGGNDAEARTSFEAAMASREVIELETASGTEIDSRRLARRALAMLERGEFRRTANTGGQLTMRQ
jgi:uncharacterized protein HemY